LELDRFVREPFDFEEVYGRALWVSLETTDATVFSLEDLKAMTAGAG